MYDLLFNVPWWIPTVLGIVGIALMVRGNRVQDDRVRIAGAGVLVIGLGWAVMSYLVDTPKETCIKQSRELVQSVVAKGWSTFDGMLDPNVRFTFEGSIWQIEGKDQLDATVRADIDKVGVTSASVTGLTAADERENIITKFTALSVQESTMGQMISSNWRFQWHLSSSGRWLVSEIRGVSVGNLDVKDIQGALPVR